MGAPGVLGGAISKIAGNRNLELRLRKTAISAYTHDGDGNGLLSMLPALGAPLDNRGTVGDCPNR